MSSKIMQDKINLDEVIKEIEQALLKIGQATCPMLNPDEYKLVVEEAERRVGCMRNLRDQFNQP